MHGRPNAERFHVRGFNEEGTTTTPFDMVVLQRHEPLPPRASRRSGARRGRDPRRRALVAHCRAMLDRHHGYIREHFEDMPEVRDWRWSEP